MPTPGLPSASLFVLAIGLAVAAGGAVPPRKVPQDTKLGPPIELTAAQDHQRLLGLLGIRTIRPGADPKNLQAPNAVNYDESKANPYPTLPNPLVLRNGKKVNSAKTWWATRRPEIVEDFDREIYGRVPKQMPSVRWAVAGTAPDAIGGIAVTTKTLVGHVDNSGYPAITVDIELTLTTPANAAGAVPVIMEFGFTFPAGAGRGSRAPGPPPTAGGPTWQEQLVAKGWGYATLYPASVQADNGAGLTKGIIGLVNKGQPRKVDDWGALRAWAWGASRALDYLETDKAVNGKQVGIEGLSRFGKAALVAMAYDSRFAIALVASSGAGGAKLYRRQFGELVENLAGSGEYHWMAGNFIKYAGPLTANDLPVDAHELIAMCAPRPVFISAGSFEVEGGWVDAKGMFLAEVGAGPVYRLLGKKDLGASELPPIETPLIDGDVAFRQHRGGHTAGPNWPTFLTFAARYVKAPPLPPAGPPSDAGAPLEMALTFDDLPVHAALPPGVSRVDVARSIVAALQAHLAPPTYGFVNGSGLDESPANREVLRLWRAAGHPLANHTFSHMDLNANTTDAFEQDVVANEAILRSYMGEEGWRWLRFPYLREGDTIEKQRAVARFLETRGYRTAQVTIEFGDWAFNDPYARCAPAGDMAAIDWMKARWLARAEQALTDAQARARLVAGHDIAHVLLLHLGAFDAVMLPALMDLLEKRGVRLLTLEEAQRDPAYAVRSDQPFGQGATWLDRMMAAKGIASPTKADDTIARLGALCK
jgi:peptidoglycan/xylan/chitin deacetylase (PgdA/CDA1 family)